MQKLSIISTLRETLQLGKQQIKLVLTLSVLTALPSVFLQWSVHILTQTTSPFIFVYPIAMTLGLLIVDAMKRAALLGVLKEPQPEKTLWPLMTASVQKYTWTLVRLTILLSIIVCFVTIPLGILMPLYGSLAANDNYFLQFMVVFMGILYPVFIKFALADPLVVVENRRARDSIKESWRMTKGRFGYVLGCYVFLGTAEYFIGILFDHFSPSDTFTLLNFANILVTSLFNSFWILMAWCMYKTIKNSPGPVELVAHTEE